MLWGLGPWAAPMWGAWWIFPLLGLLCIVVMMVGCARMVRGMMGRGGMCGHGRRHLSDADDLRRDVHELREEIRQLRAGS